MVLNVHLDLDQRHGLTAWSIPRFVLMKEHTVCLKLGEVLMEYVACYYQQTYSFSTYEIWHTLLHRSLTRGVLYLAIAEDCK